MQTPSDTELGFPAKGSLKRVPFSSLLREIAGAKITGSLYLLSGDTKKVVFFVDGRPTVVRSNLATEFLGHILTDLGLITQEQCDNTLEAIRRTGKKQGELLVEMGILSEGNLRYVLEEQLRTKLYEVFAWEEGRFQFKTGAEPGNAGTPPELSTEALIINAVQERFPDERAREALKQWADKYPAQNSKWTGDPATLDLLPEELYFLRCLDGSRTTDELLARKPELEVPQISTLLLGLIHAGVVDPLDAKLPRRLPPPRPNLNPPAIPDEQLAPKFEPLSTIGEYEDTPLPSHLPDLGMSSSKNPRVPILPTEDEEMFRGLNIDESIVTDSRKIVAAAKPKLAPREPTPIPAAIPSPALGIDDESDFSDLHADPLDDEAPAPAPSASPKLDSGKHRLGPPPGLANLLRKDSPTPAPVAASPVTPAERTPVSTPAPVAADPIAADPVAALAEDDDLPDDLGDLPDDDLPDDDLPDLGDEEEIEEIEELDELDDAEAEPDDEPDEDDLPPEDAVADALAFARTPTLPPEEPGDLGELSGDTALPDLDAGDSGLLAGDSGLLDPGDSGLLADLGDLDDDLLLPGDDAELPELDDLDGVDIGGVLEAAADLGDLGDDADLGADLGDDADLGAEGDLDADLGADGDLGDDGDLDADLGDGGFDNNHGFINTDFANGESTYVGSEIDGATDGMDAYGAQRYTEAETAMREGDYDTAVALFEDAYNAGFDVAELHAHLAFARYRASGGDPDIAQNSLELLDYAESLDPGLAMIHAYRGVVLVGLGANDQARECFERALYLDPYNELALEYRDSV